MFEREKIYHLPITRDYCRNWELSEAVRELVQNALDSDSPFEWSLGPDELSITSRNSQLSVSSLLLGSTTKAEEDEQIGSFGEGYKIALLVLVRMGYVVQINNNGKIWIPKFLPNPQFNNEETLAIVEAKDKLDIKGLTFNITLTGEGDRKLVRSCALQFQDPDKLEKITTSYGDILLGEEVSRLYVNGLYICDIPRYDYSYNVKPSHIKLERDRQTVSDWDLGDLTTKMWFESKRFNEVAAMIESESQDAYHARFYSEPMVKEACYRLFQRKYPKGIPAKNNQELTELVEKGFTNTVVVNSTFYTNVRESFSFKSSVVVPDISPIGELIEYFEANRQYMRRRGIVAFKNLLAKAKQQKWRKS